MFKVDDKIVYIDDRRHHYFEYEANLSLGKPYTALGFLSSREGNFVRIRDDGGVERHILMYKFLNFDDPNTSSNIYTIRKELLKNKMKILLRNKSKKTYD